MLRIPRDRLTYAFAPDIPPVATIPTGVPIVFETIDTSSGRLNGPNDLEAFVRDRDPKKVNPAAGPVFVEGAEPGDELVVTILDIRLLPQGWVRVIRGAGVLQTEIDPSGIVFVQVDGDTLLFGDQLRIPARPMIGVIGTSPASGIVYTAEPGPQGSNIDVNAITTGARVHLPVHVPGALLAIGDLHASMGDGEICGTGVEIGGEVTVSVEVIKQTGLVLPWIETDAEWVSYGHAPTLEAAIEIAVEDICRIIQGNLGVTRTEAFLLVSACGDVRVGQAACIPGLDATAYVRMQRPTLQLDQKVKSL